MAIGRKANGQLKKGYKITKGGRVVKASKKKARKKRATRRGRR